jgi:hypothetical protein
MFRPWNARQIRAKIITEQVRSVLACQLEVSDHLAVLDTGRAHDQWGAQSLSTPKLGAELGAESGFDLGVCMPSDPQVGPQLGP